MARVRKWKQRQTVIFFCFPPIWVESPGVTGGAGEPRQLDPVAMKEVVFQTVTSQGLAVQATRDGEFSLDFSKVVKYSLPDLTTDPFAGTRTDPIEVHWAHAGPFAWGDWRILDRGLDRAVPLVALEKSCDLLDSLLKMDAAAGITRVELYSNANRAYCEGNLIPALLQAWLVVESLLHQLWRNQPNRRELDSIFQVLNALGQSGALSAELVDRLQGIRRIRNATVHELAPPQSPDCLACLESVEQLFEIVLSLKLSLPHWQGLASGSVTFKQA